MAADSIFRPHVDPELLDTNEFVTYMRVKMRVADYGFTLAATHSDFVAPGETLDDLDTEVFSIEMQGRMIRAGAFMLLERHGLLDDCVYAPSNTRFRS